MAAGMGSRFGGLKQLAKFTKENKTLLDFAILDAIQAGFSKVVFIIRKDIEELFKEEVSAKYESQIEVCYAFQELDKLPNGYKPSAERSKPWGTGHAILCAKEFIKEPFLAINADDYYGKSSYKIVSDFMDTQSKNALLLSFKLGNTLSPTGGVSRGVCSVSENGKLIDIQEHYEIRKEGEQILDKNGKLLTENTPVSMNFWGFSENFLDILEAYFIDFLESNHSDLKAEFYLPFAVDTALKESKLDVDVLLSDEIWQGVTYLQDKEYVEAFLSNNR